MWMLLLHHLSCSTSSFMQFIHLYVCVCVRAWSSYQCVFHVCNYSVCLPQDDYIPYPRIEEVSLNLTSEQNRSHKQLNANIQAPTAMHAGHGMHVYVCVCRCWRGVGHILRSSCLSLEATGSRIPRLLLLLLLLLPPWRSKGRKKRRRWKDWREEKRKTDPQGIMGTGWRR